MQIRPTTCLLFLSLPCHRSSSSNKLSKWCGIKGSKDQLDEQKKSEKEEKERRRKEREIESKGRRKMNGTESELIAKLSDRIKEELEERERQIRERAGVTEDEEEEEQLEILRRQRSRLLSEDGKWELRKWIVATQCKYASGTSMCKIRKTETVDT